MRGGAHATAAWPRWRLDEVGSPTHGGARTSELEVVVTAGARRRLKATGRMLIVKAAELDGAELAFSPSGSTSTRSHAKAVETKIRYLPQRTEPFLPAVSTWLSDAAAGWTRLHGYRRVWDVLRGWHFVAESLVGALVVVVGAEQVEGTLRRAEVSLRWRGRLGFEGPMKPLQPAVLLRLAGLDMLDLNGKARQPHRQP